MATRYLMGYVLHLVIETALVWTQIGSISYVYVLLIWVKGLVE
jgi:hypothetical protein